MMRRIPWWLVAFLGLAGCVTTSTGFNRTILQERLHDDTGPVTDDEIKQIQALRSQISFPCRIAVALRGDGDWRWTTKDRQVMETWAEALRREGIATDVIFMSTMFLQGETLKDMRAAAAEHGADALLVIKGAAMTDSYMNPAAVFNVTVLGGFIVPGSRRDALFLMQAGLIDVRNGFLYASVEAEGEGSTIAPTFIIEERDAIDRAKQKALTNFGPELLRRMRNLYAGCSPALPPLVVRPQPQQPINPMPPPLPVVIRSIHPVNDDNQR
jgi:hypothetical protein